MHTGRWQQLEQLCESVLELEPSARPGYLRDTCGDQSELIAEVLSLVAQLDTDPDFLESPSPPTSTAATQPTIPAMPTTIGEWRLIRVLGRGGMGEVYLAEPVAFPGERVAIKVLRAAMDGDDVRRRFALERRILATLRHPNIAQLIDVTATDDGRPCFVLEYVPGMPITAFADLHRLGIAERLTLVLAVCDAVEHAHRSLVVHRDIKPENILVTEARQPKLLDFGISKVLDPAAGLGSVIDTGRNDRLLTLDYAAPEQLRSEVITTATDVHALGVLLHELLTGVHPFRREGDTPGQVEQAVLHRLPDRPAAVVRSTPSGGPVAEGDAQARAEARGTTGPESLGRRLAGDLDNIVLKALRKEPSRRYSSVEALADDLRRFLAGLPVRARPDTLGYRARKFVRRNAGSVLVGTMAVLALLGTTAAAVLESRRATRTSAAMLAERDEAVAVRSFLMEMYGTTGSDAEVGAGESVRQLIDRQAARIEREYGDRPVLAARLFEVVADAYDRLGLPSLALAPARRALAMRTGAQPPQHPDVAGAHNLLGWVHHQSGARDSAERHLREGLALRLGSPRPDSSGLARSLNDLGVLLNATDRAAEAESVLVEALAIRRRGGDEQLSVGITANNLAAAQYFQGKLSEAGVTQALAVRALEVVVGPEHQRTVIALGNLAAFRLAAGEVEQAEFDYRALLDRQSRLQGREHPVTMRVMTSLAAALLRRDGPSRAGALLEAETLVREALAVQDRLPGQGLPQLAATLERLTAIQLARGDTAGAGPTARRALGVLVTLHGANHAQVVRFRERWCVAVRGC
jgi:serine/threonine-protein kinase